MCSSTLGWWYLPTPKKNIASVSHFFDDIGEIKKMVATVLKTNVVVN